ncbi:hypothetical protein [Falsiroseomonas sp.]|uniref:hypothetical protein n=1 Tax=Falsiroseomonas sp. TaxID=2870721 RepID=UPI003563BED5
MRHVITALFHSEQAAKAGAAALRARGVPDHRIALHPEPPQEVARATENAPGGEPGLPHLLDALFLPAEDLAAHREAMRRGGFVLTAEVEAAQVEELLEALDDAGAADLDEHESSWRREGWAPAAAAGAVGTGPGGGTPMMPGTGGLDAEAARQLGTATGGGGEAPQDPRRAATRREPALGRARSYVIEAPLAEDPSLPDDVAGKGPAAERGKG